MTADHTSTLRTARSARLLHWQMGAQNVLIGTIRILTDVEHAQIQAVIYVRPLRRGVRHGRFKIESLGESEDGEWPVHGPAGPLGGFGDVGAPGQAQGAVGR
jgi:hypothetical protein